MAEHQPYIYKRREAVEPDWRRFPGWRDITAAQWRDVKWQRRNSIQSLRRLRAVLGNLADESFYADIEQDQIRAGIGLCRLFQGDSACRRLLRGISLFTQQLREHAARTRIVIADQDSGFCCAGRHLCRSCTLPRRRHLYRILLRRMWCGVQGVLMPFQYMRPGAKLQWAFDKHAQTGRSLLAAFLSRSGKEVGLYLSNSYAELRAEEELTGAYFYHVAWLCEQSLSRWLEECSAPEPQVAARW